MKFLLDNCLPHLWAASILECSEGKFPQKHVENVVALRSKFEASTKDPMWLAELGREGNWVVISADAFKKQNGAERRIIREHGLSVFVLQPSWLSQPYWNMYSQFIKWWPRIVGQSNTVEHTAVLVPWRATGKFKQI